jgi:GMP synthase (glutamine-hydrolysing)
VNILIVQNDDESGPGAIELPLRAAGSTLSFWFPDHDDPPPPLDEVDGVVALGGRVAPDGDADHPWLADERALIGESVERELPFLGLCLGAQLLVQELGGRVGTQPADELGWLALDIDAAAPLDPLFSALPGSGPVFGWHSYAIEDAGPLEVLARTQTSPQAVRHRSAWGLQFHAEIDLSMAAVWLVKGAQELNEHGIDPSALRDETAARVQASTRRAADLARRFHSVVDRHARTRATAA